MQTQNTTCFCNRLAILLYSVNLRLRFGFQTEICKDVTKGRQAVGQNSLKITTGFERGVNCSSLYVKYKCFVS